MWESYKKWNRLKKALESRGINPDNISLDKLETVLRRRGLTDRRLNNVVWEMLTLLEPPMCTMTHCKIYGHMTYVSNCAEERIPGRCDIYKKFLKRQSQRRLVVE